MFVNRAELLSTGETVEDHRKWQQEEATILERDKSNTDRKNGGLFKGVFKQWARGGPHHVFRDAQDGVDRCPECHWELNDGICEQCGMLYGSDGEAHSLDFDDDDWDDESEISQISALARSHDSSLEGGSATGDDRSRQLSLSSDDDISLDTDGHSLHGFGDTRAGSVRIGRIAARELLRQPFNRRGYTPSMLSDMATAEDEDRSLDDDEDRESDEETGSLDDFVVGDEELEDDNQPLSTYSSPSRFNFDAHGLAQDTNAHSRGGRNGQDSDPVPNLVLTEAALRSMDSETNSETEEGPISNRRRRRRAQILSDDSENDLANQTQINEDAHRAIEVVRNGWSPLHQSDEGQSRTSENHRVTQSTSDSDSAPPPPRNRKRRPVINDLSSDDDTDPALNGHIPRQRRRRSSSASTTIGRHSPQPSSMASSSDNSNRQATAPLPQASSTRLRNLGGVPRPSARGHPLVQLASDNTRGSLGEGSWPSVTRPRPSRPGTAQFSPRNQAPILASRSPASPRGIRPLVSPGSFRVEVPQIATSRRISLSTALNRRRQAKPTHQRPNSTLFSGSLEQSSRFPSTRTNSFVPSSVPDESYHTDGFLIPQESTPRTSRSPATHIYGYPVFPSSMGV